MKTRIIFISLFYSINAISQQVPTPNPSVDPTTPVGATLKGQYAWFRGGNAVIGNPAGSNNIFGTLWNSPIYTQTAGVNRMKLNGSLAYNVNGFAGARNGFLLLGPDQPLAANAGNIYTTKGAYSLLHLNGGDGTAVQELGYRDWMRTGITFTGNNDLSYFGLRQMGGAATFDQTETVIAWSDNQAGIADEMAFRFIGQNVGPTTTFSTNFSDAQDADGLHVGRFTPFGRFGLGNTFGHIDLLNNAPNYVSPASLFHMSYQFRTDPVNQPSQNEPYGFMQITYRRGNGAAGDIIGQGESATDGLRIGIDNEVQGNGGFDHLNGFLRWQEASSFIFQTKDLSNSNIQNNERMRITSVGGLFSNYPFGTYLGNLAPSNATRISFSYDGANPVKNPMSLLHLGYDVSFAGPAASPDGWRTWMNVGTFISNGSDHMYIGLKDENNSGDKSDAVIAWGDNSGATSNFGPDNLRFIFTAPSGPPTTPSSGQLIDGLEGMRMTPTDAFGVYTGVGGSLVNPYFANSSNPTSTLEVNSWGATNVPGGSSGLRFTNLNSSSPIVGNPGLGVLSVNADGDVVYVPVAQGGNAFVDCADISGAANLLTDTKVTMNNNNIYFETNDIFGKNHLGLGYNCSTLIPAKLSVAQNHPTLATTGTIAIAGYNTDQTSNSYLTFIGVQGQATGIHTPKDRQSNIGGDFYATNAAFNKGIVAKAYMPNGFGLYYDQTGAEILATGGRYNVGVSTVAQNGTGSNIGIHSSAKGGLGSPHYNKAGEFFSTGARNFGLWTQADAVSGPFNYGFGIWASLNIGPWNIGTSRAGYFNGLIQTTAAFVQTSDQMFKTDISDIENSLELLYNLVPRTYYMDTANFTNFTFGTEKQYGFIAQEIETILPELVFESVHPGTFDSLGNVVIPDTYYKALNYNALIPINTAAIKELDQEIQNQTLSDQTIKTNVVDLNNSLNKVLAMRGVSYDWTTPAQSMYDLDSCNHVGFIAQEIQQVDARLTFIGRDSLLHVEYEKVVPVLVEAIEELNTEVESKDSIINDLNARLTTLENCLSGILPYLCQLSQSSVQANTPESQEAIRTQLSVKLTNKETIVLDQNVPNPFAEQTVINFSIPETVQKAQIHFYNAEGRIIQSVDVVERGLGSITVFGSDLSSGIYTYTLVADGISVATKKMMKN